MFHYEPLSASQATAYATMTYGKYQAFLETDENEYVRFLRLGATLDGEPVGLLIGQISHKTQESGLLSLYTAPPYRNRGVATGLVAAYENWLREQKSP